VPYEPGTQEEFLHLGTADPTKSFYRATLAAWLQGEQRRATFVRYLEDHPATSIADAMKRFDEKGISNTTYQKWRKSYPRFKRIVDNWVADRKPALPRFDPFNQGFAEFRWTYFGMKTFHHQREWIERIENNKPLHTGLILAPPDHGKTSILEDFICYKLALDPNLRFIIMSQSAKHAQEMIGRIKERMTDPDSCYGGDGRPSRYISDWGPFKVYGKEAKGPEDADDAAPKLRSWTQNEITVHRKTSNERSPSVLARGWTSRIQGKRCDYLIIDDVQDLDNVPKSKAIIQKIRQEGLTRLDPVQGRAVIIATRVDNDDIYDLLLGDDPEYNGILDWVVEMTALNAEGEALWPERWPADKLAIKRRSVGEATWWRCYMQNPQAATTATFSPDVLERGKRDDLHVGVKVPGGLTVLGYDPALVGGACGVVMSAESFEELRFVDARLSLDLASFDNVVADLAELIDWYDPDIVAFEVNADNAGYLEQPTFKDLKRRKGFRLVRHITTGAKKVDRTLGISAMPRSWWKGQMAVPWGDETDRAVFMPLLDQHTKWRPGVPDKLIKQDYVIATWLAWRVLQQELQVINRANRTPGKRGWDNMGAAVVGLPSTRTA
jgi:hypothetical protein